MADGMAALSQRPGNRAGIVAPVAVHTGMTIGGEDSFAVEVHAAKPDDGSFLRMIDHGYAAIQSKTGNQAELMVNMSADGAHAIGREDLMKIALYLGK